MLELPYSNILELGEILRSLWKHYKKKERKLYALPNDLLVRLTAES